MVLKYAFSCFFHYFYYFFRWIGEKYDGIRCCWNPYSQTAYLFESKQNKTKQIIYNNSNTNKTPKQQQNSNKIIKFKKKDNHFINTKILKTWKRV